LTHHRLPESLTGAGVDSRVCADPFNGRPLAYRPYGRDYLLYSVGPDGVDDGGLPRDETNPDSKGDVGMTRFQIPSISFRNRFYRRVPHMKTPVLPPGAPPLPNR